MEKDKLIFSFLMAQKLLEVDNIISMKEIRFLMMGGSGDLTAKEKMPISAKFWLPQ